MNEDRNEELSRDRVFDQRLQDTKKLDYQAAFIRKKRSESRSAKMRYRTRTLVRAPMILNAKKTYGYERLRATIS